MISSISRIFWSSCASSWLPKVRSTLAISPSSASPGPWSSSSYGLAWRRWSSELGWYPPGSRWRVFIRKIPTEKMDDDWSYPLWRVSESSTSLRHLLGFIHEHVGRVLMNDGWLMIIRSFHLFLTWTYGNVSGYKSDKWWLVDDEWGWIILTNTRGNVTIHEWGIRLSTNQHHGHLIGYQWLCFLFSIMDLMGYTAYICIWNLPNYWMKLDTMNSYSGTVHNPYIPCLDRWIWTWLN